MGHTTRRATCSEDDVPSERADLTRLLQDWKNGDPAAAERLLAASYEQLRRIARGMLRYERRDHTLQATSLVHEAYLRLFPDAPVDLASREAFFRLFATEMRRHLIDHARRRAADKRGGQFARVDADSILDNVAAPAHPDDEQLFARLDEALAVLERERPRVAAVVRLRFFASLTNDAVASALHLSPATVKRDYALGRAWLAHAIGHSTDNS
jgi:RNA polymerase sigma factor (TIGR02999 family)